jgi:hypothetical protein
VGWELDVGWGDNAVRQFTFWAMIPKPPGLPHVSMVVEDILDALREKT